MNPTSSDAEGAVSFILIEKFVQTQSSSSLYVFLVSGMNVDIFDHFSPGVFKGCKSALACWLSISRTAMDFCL